MARFKRGNEVPIARHSLVFFFIVNRNFDIIWCDVAIKDV